MGRLEFVMRMLKIWLSANKLRLLRWKDKQAIMSAKERLHQINIFTQEDYSKGVMDRRNMLLPIFFKALELYPTLSPKFQVDKFVLGLKVFTVDNINTIHYPELLLEQVFTSTNSGINPFYTKFSPLSNFYMSEHDFTYMKANFIRLNMILPT